MSQFPPDHKFAKIHLAINREGYFLIFLLLALGGSGIYSGNNSLLFLFCVMGALFLLSIPFARANLLGLSFERVLGREFFAGSEYQIVLRVVNQTKRAKFGLHFYENFENHHVIGPMFLKHLGAHETLNLSYTCQFFRRGSCQFRAIEVRSRFPSSFLELRLSYPLEEKTLIFPQLLSDFEDFSENALSDGISRDISKATDELLKPWRVGTSMNRVAWKLSTKRGQIIEKRVLKGMLSRNIAIRLRLGGKSGDLEYEREISNAASLALRKLSEGFSVSLWRGEDLLVPAAGGEEQRVKILIMLSKL